MNSVKKFLHLSIPLYANFLIAFALIGIAIFIFLEKTNAAEKKLGLQKQEASDLGFCDIKIIRNNNYEFTHPILLAEMPDEDSHLQSLKGKLSALIDLKTQQAMISSASVYFKEFSNGGWFSINKDGLYNPGSLVKVAILISYFKESESNPGLLDKKLFLDPKYFKKIPHQTYELNAIEPGQSYTIGELLKRMIIDSDNYSTGILNMNVNLNIFKQLYSDTDQPIPDIHDIAYQTNVSNYSKFFRILYNGSYLKKENSDYCLKLLSESSFDDGMTKLLPTDVLVSRKFGEFGLKKEKQWHESGIVYYNNKPYLITIMTKGFDTVKMKQTISEISQLIFTSNHQSS